jgi:hypothetical protein
MAIGGEEAHVDADLGNDHLAREGLDARDRAQLFDGGTKGRDIGLDVLLDLEDRGFKGIDLLEMQAEQKAMLLVTRPRRAADSCAGDAFRRRSAKAASLVGLVSPAIMASIVAQPVLPMMSAITESNLILASSTVFCTRWMWLAASRTSCLLVRMRARNSCVWISGTKLARDRAPTGRSAIRRR